MSNEKKHCPTTTAQIATRSIHCPTNTLPDITIHLHYHQLPDSNMELLSNYYSPDSNMELLSNYYSPGPVSSTAR
ncbi:Hypothetical predicted protein [Pelobates cultripes]|uniref:Uncharacterized protein n=1 Tax=Pelobates cultripes TaxID=61616 RepID=A0AAD1WQ94_PELCU|nr:Hypothetical predicted protein [Pelobates cultripes]